jgi:ATP-dependent DNA helicase RecG
LAVESGKQGALMAPTELLAEQHFQTLRHILEPAGIRVHLVTSSTGGAKAAAATLADGVPCVAVGTHALIQGGLELGSLALAVVDEQHRFGVQDRLKLQAKGRAPHVLLMSATPIPRTLALAFRGDLDLSVLDELPPGRRPVQTKLYSGKARAKAMDALHATIAAGQQAYVVYPLVSESEKLDLANATDGAAKLKAALPGARVGLVHGQLPTAERERTMTAFRAGQLDVLVATTVIEVGVDVPNATLAIVSQAERFGLSQLHQLRGRVGRGGHESQCLLLAHGPLSRAARQRLKALVDSRDGFHIAEIDLKMRGPGEILGTRQSGLPELSFADPLRQSQLLEVARKLAFDLVERDPQLVSPEARKLTHGLDRLFGRRRSLGHVG